MGGGAGDEPDRRRRQDHQARAASSGTTIREITEPVIEIFHEDREYLRIQGAEHYPRATEFIPQMIALVERLIDKGVAYQADDGSVYFAIAQVSGVRQALAARHAGDQDRRARGAGRLRQGERAGFRALEGGEAEDERVGAAWDSPWGRGRPGWHLECSAMAMSICSARRSTSTAAASISSFRTTRTRSRRARPRRA